MTSRNFANIVLEESHRDRYLVERQAAVSQPLSKAGANASRAKDSFQGANGFSFRLKVLWRKSDEPMALPLPHKTFTMQPIQDAAASVDERHEPNQMLETFFKWSFAIELDQLEYKATDTRANLRISADTEPGDLFRTAIIIEGKDAHVFEVSRATPVLEHFIHRVGRFAHSRALVRCTFFVARFLFKQIVTLGVPILEWDQTKPPEWMSFASGAPGNAISRLATSPRSFSVVG